MHKLLNYVVEGHTVSTYFDCFVLVSLKARYTGSVGLTATYMLQI